MLKSDMTIISEMTDAESAQTQPMMSAKDARESREYNYDIIFTRILPQLESGRPLSELLREIAERETNLDITGFRRWVHNDDARSKTYKAAKKIGARCVEDEMLRIADDVDKDVYRSKLQLDTRKWLLGVWDRDTYGDKREVTNTSDKQVNIFIDGITPKANTGLTIDNDDPFLIGND